ncbi:hypothetical protein TEK04_09015 [Klenkia sp. LSe6-5]|uniref:Uncharacterized protein n=1 Tax=Klenkia sesuvii TaxID=3103137 RepID=A0ABU8DTT7_9ACTN
MDMHNEKSPGHYLHGLISDARSRSNLSISDAWEKTLGAGFDTYDGVARHQEVVNLVQEVCKGVEALPRGSAARDRGMRYVPAWYRAVVYQGNWDAPVGNLINNTAMDLLGATADLLEVRAPAPAGSLELLVAELDGIFELIDATPELAETQRAEIITQLKHVQWLIENADMFGVGPIQRESERAAGKITRTVFTQPMPGQRRKAWVKRWGGLLLALTLLQQGSEQSAAVLENTHQALGTVIEMAEDVSSIFSDVPALPPAD